MGLALILLPEMKWNLQQLITPSQSEGKWRIMGQAELIFASHAKDEAPNLWWESDARELIYAADKELMENR